MKKKPIIMDDIIDHIFYVQNAKVGTILHFEGEFKCYSTITLMNYINENYEVHPIEMRHVQSELMRRLFHYGYLEDIMKSVIDNYITAFNRYYKAIESGESTELNLARNEYEASIKNLHKIKAPGSIGPNDIAAWHRFHMEHVVKYYGKPKQFNF